MISHGWAGSSFGMDFDDFFLSRINGARDARLLFFSLNLFPEDFRRTRLDTPPALGKSTKLHSQTHTHGRLGNFHSAPNLLLESGNRKAMDMRERDKGERGREETA